MFLTPTTIPACSIVRSDLAIAPLPLRLRPLNMLSHDCQPLRFDRFDALVQKRIHGPFVCFTAKFFSAESLGSPEKRSKRCGKRDEKSDAPWNLSSLNDHDLIIRITCSACQAFDVSLEQLEAIGKFEMMIEIFFGSDSSRLTQKAWVRQSTVT